MGDFELWREQWIPAPRSRVFPFFSDPGNLATLTPPWLHFRITEPWSGPLEPGARVGYRIRLAGLPVRWTTRIPCWEPPDRFVDVQERGPYAHWEHTHWFHDAGDAVWMTDRVRYRLPLGAVGRAAHAAGVRSALDRIFDYRFRRIRELFGTPRALEDGPVRG